MLDPTGRKALVCQGIPELTSKLHAGSSHAHVSCAVNPKRWFRAETTATRRGARREVVRLATFTARVMGCRLADSYAMGFREMCVFALN